MSQYYDLTNDSSLNSVYIQNYMKALINVQKIQTDISVCSNPALFNVSGGIPYRDFHFLDNGSLTLPINGTISQHPVTTGSQYGSNNIRFDNSPSFQMMPSSSNCNAFNNTSDIDKTIDTSANWILDNSNGLVDYIYYEYNQAYADVSNHLKPGKVQYLPTDISYNLIDIDASYQNIVSVRNHLDNQMQNLYNVKGSIPYLFMQQYDSTLFTTMLWTILGIILLYYLFLKL